MPYIPQERRPRMDKVVEALKEANVKADGDLNYILYKFCKETVTPGYNNLKNFCGELRACAVEIERTILGPYEDSAKKRNGAV